MTTTAISASINGVARTFQIHREDLPYFEAAFGSAIGVYRRLIDGEWTSDLILRILRFASGTRPNSKLPPDHFKMRYQTEESLRELRRDDRPRDVIEDAFVAKGPAVYALLAQQVLAAALFGLKPEESVFSDEAEAADGDE